MWREDNNFTCLDIVCIQTSNSRTHVFGCGSKVIGTGACINLSTNEESYKIVDGIKFSLLSPNEIRKLSTVEIQTADTYDEDGVPIVAGLMDGRLGTLEPRQKCRTCGNTAVACPGHFGHIELAEPVIHVSFVKLIHKLLAVTCRNCGRILLSEEKIKEYQEKIKEVETRLNTGSGKLKLQSKSLNLAAALSIYLEW